MCRLVALQVGVALVTTASIVADVHQDTPFVVASKSMFNDMFFGQVLHTLDPKPLDPRP